MLCGHRSASCQHGRKNRFAAHWAPQKNAIALGLILGIIFVPSGSTATEPSPSSAVAGVSSTGVSLAGPSPVLTVGDTLLTAHGAWPCALGSAAPPPETAAAIHACRIAPSPALIAPGNS